MVTEGVNIITECDYHGGVDDLAGVAALLGATPGVVEHGLFPPMLVADAFV